MRAALLPTPGDIPTLRYWLRNFRTWSDRVDELVVFINGGGGDPRAANRLIEEAGGRMIHSPHSAGHDGAMLRLLMETDADVVVMCEDDAYVRHPEAVGAAFEDVETGDIDIVGSPRHEDYAGTFVEWGEYHPGDLWELRHGLWPAFLFCRRADLLATDRVFGDRAWPRGGTIPGWGYVGPAACDFVGIAAEFVHLDTFFGTTFQLRSKGLRTRLVHHVRLYDPVAVREWLAEDPPWFHVTNLSTLPGIREDPRSLPDWGPGGGLWTRRVAWWRRMGIDVSEFIRRALINPADVDRWDEAFAPWVTWETG